MIVSFIAIFDWDSATSLCVIAAVASLVGRGLSENLDVFGSRVEGWTATLDRDCLRISG